MDEGIQRGTGSHHGGAPTTICLGLLDNEKTNEDSLDDANITPCVFDTEYSESAAFVYTSGFEGVLLLDLFLKVSRDFTNLYISEPSEQKQN